MVKVYERSETDEFVFEDWVRDGLKGVRTKVQNKMNRQRIGDLDISNFRMHMRNARKEQLLAVRSLVDSAIEYLDKQEKQHHD